MTPAEAIEKIKKLIRMRHGGAPAEIAAALRLAQNLADEHGVDLSQVNADDDGLPNSLGHDVVRLGNHIGLQHTLAATMCAEFFSVDVIFGWQLVRHDGVVYLLAGYERILNIIGLPHHREVARYVFIFLVSSFNRAWRTKRGRCRNRTDFMAGMAAGIAHNLRASQPPAPPAATSALMVTREAYTAKHFPKTKTRRTPKVRSSAALTRGYLEGRNTHVRPAINSQPETQQLQLEAVL